jgi:hypothetical protein
MCNCGTLPFAGKALDRLTILGGVCMLTALLSGCGKEPVSASTPTASISASSPESLSKPIGKLADATTAVKPADSSATKVPATIEEQRKLLIGKWTQQRTGTRNLTVREDGTATMTVDLISPYRFVFGNKLTVEIAWTLKDGRLIFETTGGKPSVKVDVLTKMFGNKRDQPILELSSTRLLLKDADKGEPDHDWSRVTTK